METAVGSGSHSLKSGDGEGRKQGLALSGRGLRLLSKTHVEGDRRELAKERKPRAEQVSLCNLFTSSLRRASTYELRTGSEDLITVVVKEMEGDGGSSCQPRGGDEAPVYSLRGG